MIALPKGSTPVDFAYAIHTELGNHCVGAKVNGRLVPLDYRLQTGDRVEILTSPQKKPSPEWLKFVKTSKARQRIKQFLRKEVERLLLEEGKKIWHKIAEKYDLSLEEVLKKTKKTERELFIQLAQRKLTEKWLLSTVGKRQTSSTLEGEKTAGEGVLEWEEFKGVKYTVAKCCHPLPGEEVKAVIQKGKGLVIHSKNCPNLKNLERVAPQKVFTVRWKGKGSFPAPLRIVSHDYVGLLGEITSIFAKEGVNIVKLESTTRGEKAYITVVGEFRNIDHLRRVEGEISKLPEVLEIKKI